MKYVVKKGRSYFIKFSCTGTDRWWTWTNRQRDAWHFAELGLATGWAADSGGHVVRIVPRTTPARNDPNAQR